MKYDRILIRYGEISTKGRNRKKFIDKLRMSIKKTLTDFPRIKIEANRDRMYVLLNGEDSTEIIPLLKDVFGIQSFSPAVKVEKDLEKMKEAVLGLFSKVHKEGHTFKITGRRADRSFPLDTDEINHYFGAHILRNIPNLKVKVKNPDINLIIEIREEAAYLSCENILGAGGLPANSSSKAMLMLSGGIDSPVAGYMALRRGLELEVVHFFSPPYTSDRAKQKVMDLAEKLAEISGSITVHIVQFTEIQELIQKQIPDNYTMTATRRLMLRITDELRRKNDGLAIITGESLGQVASQTLESMYAINEVTNSPVLRPLIMMDKPEIMEIAKKIGTYDISIRPYEDCCTIFVPAAPKTKPKREKVNHFESFVDFEAYVQRAVMETETLTVPSKKQNETNSDVEDLF